MELTQSNFQDLIWGNFNRNEGKGKEGNKRGRRKKRKKEEKDNKGGERRKTVRKGRENDKGIKDMERHHLSNATVIIVTAKNHRYRNLQTKIQQEIGYFHFL